MSNHWRRWLPTVATLLGLLANAQEPTKPKLTPRIVTATRQVAMFTSLEKHMLSAVEKKDKAAIENMLADDCEINFPKADPLACFDWVDSVVAKEFFLKSFAIRNMSVTDLGNAAVVNFERAQKATNASKDLSGEFFVVDLWRKNGDTWRLANRFVSRVTGADSEGFPTPTGKE